MTNSAATGGGESVDPTREELRRWSEEEVLADKGGTTPDVDFAEITRWGSTPGEADAEAQLVAHELGIEEEITLSLETPDTNRSVCGWWNPFVKVLGVNQPAWEAARGWKRLETIAHEVMHPHQTLTRDNWEPGWSEYAKLAAATLDPGITRGSEEFWRRQWAYRHHPLEAEASAFGRGYRDRRRATKT